MLSEREKGSANRPMPPRRTPPSHIRVAGNHLELLVKSLSSNNKTPAELIALLGARLGLDVVTGVVRASTLFKPAGHLLADFEDLDGELTSRAEHDRSRSERR